MFYNINLLFCEILLSLPSRERGLKYHADVNRKSFPYVAPFAGAWIEICNHQDQESFRPVAPFAGAWIEMSAVGIQTDEPLSLPSRERGLK